MVIRRSASTACSGRRLVAAAAVWLAACSLLAAQEGQKPAEPPPAGTPAPPTGATPPATPPAAPAVANAPSTQPTYGKIVAEQARLRCWSGAVAEPPVFEETLTKDQVVAVGRSENGFRAVLLPLGPLGYVSRKFTDASPDGRVKTKGTKVAFRYRPRSSEAPVAQLADGTELHVVGEQDDWYRVRVPGIEAWVAEAEIHVGDQAEAALAIQYAELQSRHEAEVKARLDAVAAKAARAAQDEVDLAAVQVVQDAYLKEMQKPLSEQQFDPLYTALDKLAATLATDSAGRSAIDALRKRMDTQRWIAEATVAVNQKPPQPNVPPPEKKDTLERFQSIGWLRYEGRLAGPGIYYLEKGGQRQYLLSCNTGRYDLALFVDCEVGVVGPRRRPQADSLSVLDVERIEVLGTATK
jgi:SH3-like domain-containing protein